MNIKLSVIGSRSFNDYDLLEKEINSLHFDIDLIISGGAKGADTLGEQYANKYGIKTMIFKPNWKKYGMSAGFKRNRDIIQKCDAVIAFWDGISKGTKNSLDTAKKLKKYIIIVDTS